MAISKELKEEIQQRAEKHAHECFPYCASGDQHQHTILLLNASASYSEGATHYAEKLQAKEAELKESHLRFEALQSGMELGKLEALLEKADKTLEWYANAGPMDLPTDCDYREEKIGTIFAPGKRARSALAEIRRERGEK